MFNLKEMAREAKTANLESHEGGQDATIAFTNGYEAGMMEAQVDSGFDVLAEANDDMNTIMEARAIVEGNLESGTVTDGLREAYQKTMLKIEGKYGIDGLSDANLESGDAVKGFLKKLAANARMIIAKIAAMAKKVWLKFSAWLTTSDSKIKELTKKLNKLKDEVENKNKVAFIKGEERVKSSIRKKYELKLLVDFVGDTDEAKKVTDDLSASYTDIKSVFDNAENATAEAVTGNKIKLKPITVKDNIELSDDKTQYLLRDKGTKTYIVAMDIKYITLLAVNDSFVPEDSDDDPVYTVKVVKIERDIDIEEVVDADYNSLKNKSDIENNGVYKSKVESAKDISDALDLVGKIPKSSAVKKLIDNGFKDLDKSAKAVEKEFGKPDEWAEKGKQAIAKKNTYIAGSTVVYKAVQHLLKAYKVAINNIHDVSSAVYKVAPSSGESSSGESSSEESSS